MRIRVIAGSWAIAVSLTLSAASFEADSKRGADIFREQNCTTCHKVGASGGGSTAPDLARRLDRNYTPAGIASLMWNHGPIMFAAMQKQGVPMPRLTESQAADLFAFFYSAHYFEKPGEAQRGKALFASKGCAGCHALTADTKTIGPPVSQWDALAAPIALVQAMWAHAPQMRQAMETRQMPWPQLTSQDMSDLLVYLQNLPQTRNQEHSLLLPSPAGGDQLFRSKGCVNCHTNERAFSNLIGDSTLTDVAAAMWNHAPLMIKNPPSAPGTLSLDEMRVLLSYIWAQQFFSPKGDSAKGQRVFQSQKCASCHGDAKGGAPELSRGTGPFSAVRMVAVLWSHGPAMKQRMEQSKMRWPTLSPSDMANLIAYLNQR
jgi:cytochrome c2